MWNIIHQRTRRALPAVVTAGKGGCYWSFNSVARNTFFWNTVSYQISCILLPSDPALSISRNQHFSCLVNAKKAFLVKTLALGSVPVVTGTARELKYFNARESVARGNSCQIIISQERMKPVTLSHGWCPQSFQLDLCKCERHWERKAGNGRWWVALKKWFSVCCHSWKP